MIPCLAGVSIGFPSGVNQLCHFVTERVKSWIDWAIARAAHRFVRKSAVEGMP